MEQTKKRKAWNKGLTKENHLGIARVASKKSLWWKSGERKETREKIGNSSRGRPGLRGDKNPWWKGGRRIDSRDGYVLVHKPEHLDSRKDGSILEHRLVMETILGRRLTKDEDVNHINGKKDDNRPENLKLVRHYAHYEEMCCPKCEFKFLTR